jgi:hypothetical protein
VSERSFQGKDLLRGKQNRYYAHGLRQNQVMGSVLVVMCVIDGWGCNVKERDTLMYSSSIPLLDLILFPWMDGYREEKIFGWLNLRIEIARESFRKEVKA